MKKEKRFFKALTWILFLSIYQAIGYGQDFVFAKTGQQISQPAIAQTEKQSLINVLNEIESRFKISFLYQKKNLYGKTVDGEIEYNLPIEKLLNVILLPNNLNFEKSNSTTYVIYTGKRKPTNENLKKTTGNEPEPSSITTTNAGTVINYTSVKETVNIVVKGIITNEANKPLSGVSVVEKGTSNGVSTDAKGGFSISVKNESSILVFSYIGYISQEVTLGLNRELTIALQPDVKQTDEVVVIAYGSRAKKDLTGAVSSITAGDIVKSTALSPQLAMQGRMAGVFVSSPGGDPNSAPTVRIRGVTTFSGTGDPLYVVDGVVIEEYGSKSTFTVGYQKAGDLKGRQNIFNLISPADIESISVLKDASSAAAYGSRGANGVILITTKKGKDGKAKFNFTGQKGFSNIGKRLKTLNTAEYVSIVNEANVNNLNFGEAKYNIYKKDSAGYLGNSPTYDWQDAIINKNANTEEYNLSMSGGSPGANYYVSGGYATQESDLKFNKQKRYTLSTRTEFKLNKFFEIGQTLRLAYTDLTDNRGNSGIPADLYNAIRVTPWQPIYNKDGRNGFQEVAANQFGRSVANFLAYPNYTNNNFATNKVLGNAYATLIPVKGLRMTGTVGIDYFTGRRIYWETIPAVFFNAQGGNGNNGLTEVNTVNFSINKKLAAEYITNFGVHSLNLYAHAEQTNISFHGVDAIRNGIIGVSDPNYFTVSGRDADATTFKDRGGYIAYLGRMSYKYSDKYYADVTVLRQGSSKFNPAGGKQWGTFPAVSAAWRISREKFMHKLPFDDFKIKAGIGQLGNDDTKAWQYLSLVNNTFSSYNLAGTPQLGAFFTNYPNALLTWEKLTTYNAGFDVTYKNNLTVSFEYYKRVTAKILQPYSLPSTAGISESPLKNIGAAENTGIELSAAYKNHFHKFNYNIGFNITTTKNKVTKLDGNNPVGTPAGFVILGDPFNSIYGYKTAGVIKTAAQLTAYKTTYATSPGISQLQLGDLMYQDIGGAPTPEDIKAGRRISNKPDGKIDNYDAGSLIGKRIPGFFYGINLSGNYEQLDFSILLQGVGDVQEVNYIKQASTNYDYGNQLKSTLDHWSTSNTNSNNPRAVNTGASADNNNQFSNRFVESAAFLRFANLQVGYTLPNYITEKAKFISSCRFFISGSNLFLITKFSGYDPENQFVPAPRTIIGGVNISF
jgi:TonB-dependent starch-binding outer membrane protein SusC